MQRFHVTSKGNITFTEEEEQQRDIDEAEAIIRNDAEAAIQKISDDKMTGVEFVDITNANLSTMCSATKADQNGLTAVSEGLRLASENNFDFPPTVFEFSNGNTLVITSDNFIELYKVWVPFRQSFYTV